MRIMMKSAGSSVHTPNDNSNSKLEEKSATLYLGKEGRVLAVRAQKVQKHVGNRRLVVARVQHGHVLLERRRLGEAERLLGLQRLRRRNKHNCKRDVSTRVKPIE